MTTSDTPSKPTKTRRRNPRTLYNDIANACERLGVSTSATVQDLLDELKTEFFEGSWS
jgi:hypothetical protein